MKLSAFKPAVLLERDYNTGVFLSHKSLRKSILKNASELTLRSDCLELCY